MSLRTSYHESRFTLFNVVFPSLVMIEYGNIMVLILDYINGQPGGSKAADPSKMTLQ